MILASYPVKFQDSVQLKIKIKIKKTRFNLYTALSKKIKLYTV